MHEYLKLAAEKAKPTSDLDYLKNFWLGCVGVRSDGVIVTSKNMGISSPDLHNFKPDPRTHAEGKVCRKMDKYGDGVLYVARIAKVGEGLAMARPCNYCQPLIKAYNIKRVYYTINNNQYGVWMVNGDIDKIYNC